MGYSRGEAIIEKVGTKQVTSDKRQETRGNKNSSGPVFIIIFPEDLLQISNPFPSFSIRKAEPMNQ